MSNTGTRFLDNLRVFVVEDETIISFLLEDMFVELGALHVQHAGNVSSALAYLKDRTPDLAVLDVNLGGERAYPVAEILESRKVPFLFTTGYGRSGLDARWARHPVVQKPFNIEVMTAALRELFAGRPSA
jgi:DNA-binding response OmpR family regulator